MKFETPEPRLIVLFLVLMIGICINDIIIFIKVAEICNGNASYKSSPNLSIVLFVHFVLS